MLKNVITTCMRFIFLTISSTMNMKIAHVQFEIKVSNYQTIPLNLCSNLIQMKGGYDGSID